MTEKWAKSPRNGQVFRSLIAKNPKLRRMKITLKPAKSTHEEADLGIP
jgi:hypothetical protein